MQLHTAINIKENATFLCVVIYAILPIMHLHYNQIKARIKSVLPPLVLLFGLFIYVLLFCLPSNSFFISVVYS